MYYRLFVANSIVTFTLHCFETYRVK